MNSISLVPTVRDILGGGDSDSDSDSDRGDICNVKPINFTTRGNVMIIYYIRGAVECEYKHKYLETMMKINGVSSSVGITKTLKTSSHTEHKDNTNLKKETEKEKEKEKEKEILTIKSNGNIPDKFINMTNIEKLTSNETFFENQESLGCGRHALNNLLGGKYFINEYEPKIDINNIGELPGKQPIALQTICRYLKKLYYVMDDCPDNEYYDINTLMFALALYGFTLNDSDQYNKNHQDITKRDLQKYFNTVAEENLIGFIIHFPGHWTCVRKESSNYRYIDSMNTYHTITYTEKKLVSLLSGTSMDFMYQVHYNGKIIDRSENFIAFAFLNN